MVLKCGVLLYSATLCGKELASICFISICVDLSKLKMEVIAVTREMKKALGNRNFQIKMSYVKVH